MIRKHGKDQPQWLDAMYLPRGDAMVLCGVLGDKVYALGQYYPFSEARVIGMCGNVKEGFVSVYFSGGRGWQDISAPGYN